MNASQSAVLTDEAREPSVPRASPPCLPGEDSPLLMHNDRGDGPEQHQLAGFPKNGVEDMEAVRSMWTPTVLAAAYLGVLLVIFGNGLESQASSNLMPYATSEFSEHALVSTVGISSSFIAGVARIPVAKLVDIWGRGEGFVVMVASATLGLALMAVCRNIAVYVIAQVFYAVGTDSANYILHVFMADVSTLRNRALAFGFATTPYLLTAFAGPALAQWFQKNSTWRWAEGLIRRSHLQKAEPLKLWLRRLAVEFDVVGASLFVTGLALILIPLSLQSHYAGGLLDVTMISQCIAGLSSLLLFGAWEARYAPVPLIPYRVIMNRTVAGSCLLCFGCFVANGCYHTYFPSFLQVVHRLSIRDAGYIANISSITACLCGVSIAWLIRQTGRFKPFGLLAQPIRALGLLCMIPAVARGPSVSTAVLVGCQFGIAISGSMLVAANNTAVNAAVAKKDIAIVIAVLLLFSSVGNSVGTAVGGVVWANSMPRLLREYLPDGKKHLALAIYGSLKKQLAFPDGSEERAAIVKAYCVTETRLCVYAALSVPFVIACVLMWRDVPVRDEMDGRAAEGEHLD
ncbi:putative siderophore iron transporter mirb protein [Neofusicoccum parvum UCRNP2]|uniref:Putative siderophore iron transporter mirb protein n=1 Tax=Botryosphaeria parva (strain UCR-NP2) TaxID=1287680 RepID=R1GGR8_BOTPV|nr:putative siderophore iron transporter mirb protein [Neofusicoccum parvum UCRNP2]